MSIDHCQLLTDGDFKDSGYSSGHLNYPHNVGRELRVARQAQPGCASLLVGVKKPQIAAEFSLQSAKICEICGQIIFEKLLQITPQLTVIWDCHSPAL